jgi:hypothetical protein
MTRRNCKDKETRRWTINHHSSATASLTPQCHRRPQTDTSVCRNSAYLRESKTQGARPSSRSIICKQAVSLYVFLRRDTPKLPPLEKSLVRYADGLALIQRQWRLHIITSNDSSSYPLPFLSINNNHHYTPSIGMCIWQCQIKPTPRSSPRNTMW